MSDTLPLISVIVPVYNTEQYLRKCIDSIRNQTYPNLEIILVNDGSTDSSGQLCERFRLEDSRIRVIHQENRGLSAARNAGLDLCQGAYIAFVDSDDHIFPDMYEKMLSCIQQESIDICVCNWQYETDDGKHVVRSENINSDILGRKTALEFAYWLYRGSYENGVVIAAWNKLYRKEIFSNLRFSGRYAEDDEIIGKILLLDPRIFVMKQQFYVYVQNPSSLTNDAFSAKRLLLLSALEKRVCLFSGDPYLLRESARLYCNMYIEYFYKARTAGVNMPDIQIFDRMVKLLLQAHACRLKFFARMLLFRLSPSLYQILIR